MNKSEAAKRLRELATDVMKPWSEVHSIFLAIDGGHGRIMVKGIKANSLQVFDALTSLAEELDKESAAQ